MNADTTVHLAHVQAFFFINTPIQEKTGSRMEARPKGPHTQNGDVIRFL